MKVAARRWPNKLAVLANAQSEARSLRRETVGLDRMKASKQRSRKCQLYKCCYYMEEKMAGRDRQMKCLAGCVARQHQHRDLIVRTNRLGTQSEDVLVAGE